MVKSAFAKRVCPSGHGGLPPSIVFINRGIGESLGALRAPLRVALRKVNLLRGSNLKYIYMSL